MADEALESEKPAEQPAATPPAKKGRPLIKILLLGTVLGGVGLGVSFFLGGKHKPVATEETQNANKVADASAEKTQIITLKPIVVNLRNTKGTRYLKVTIGMETKSAVAALELEQISPKLTDFLIDKFSDLEMAEMDNAVGRSKLKRDIMTGTNELLSGGYVNAVYFTEFVVQ